MKRFYMMNGWHDAPHCWWRYVVQPFGWDHIKHPEQPRGWVSVSLFGFAFFWVYG